MSQSKNLLAIIAQKDLFAKLAPFLKRGPIEVHRATEVSTGFILAANVRYDLIVLEHPLPGAATQQVLDSLGKASPMAESSPVLLLSTPRAEEELSELGIDGKHLMVLPQSVPEAALHGTISKLLGLKSRLSKRILVQLEVRMEDSMVLRACQTRDISETGMFLRTSNPLPIGTLVRASFSLPNDPRPFSTTVRVIRHANRKRELAGMAVQLERIEPEDRERLAEWIRTEFTDYDNCEPDLSSLPATASSQAGGL